MGNMEVPGKKKLHLRRIALAGTLVSLVCLLAAVPDPSRAAEPAVEKFKVGDKAPDFALQDLAGRQVRLSDHAGKNIVILAFWALRCSACITEAPYLEQIHAKYGGKGAILLAINTDGVDAKTIAATLQDLKLTLTYTILLDPEFSVSDLYTNFVVPLTLVIDRKGIVRYIHTGFEKGDEKKYDAAIRAALGS